MNRPKNLSELQLLIQQSVQTRTLQPELMGVILEKPPISIRERVSIYQDAYQIRLLESLRDDFARVESSIGEEQFEKLALNFIRENLSVVRNLAEYSEKFPDFIKVHQKNAYVVAVTDWLEVLSSHAPNPEKQLSSEEIQSGGAFQIQSLPSTITQQIDESRIAIFRNHGETKTLDLPSPLFALLQFLEGSRTVDEISEFAQRNQIGDELIAKTIHDWISHQIIYIKPL